ncbi:4-dimethylallyltryptophan N-methyltransferase [Rhypophila decipiens]|uniref:4-dimethylallyltryptophan N-methyltransferase n=1 Tax=Rhypophila decipiens TaxID=261697 RepID=A0AAN6Y704_9PEZI|nr:4-dimethylallyltryptophan N-methyltransferase [Rhypophila decipiens]
MPPSAEYAVPMPIGISTGYKPNKQIGNKCTLDMKPTSNSSLDIIDIRRVAVETNLKTEILSMFHAKDGPRQLPTLLLYDEKGLQLFERITYLEEYYLTNDEIAVLGSNAADIARLIPSGAMVIELGSGNLRKVNLLLQALENAAKKVDYYALDLSLEELQRTLAQLPRYEHVQAHGLLGTYDDGREWLKVPSIAMRQKCILSLGSSIGNFDRDDAAAFLKNFADVLNPGDTMLIGVDHCHDPAKVYHAYNDREGVTHKFVLNGLQHANRLLGETTFVEKDWAVIGEYVYDAEGGRHQAFYFPLRDTVVMGELVRPHERIQVEQSCKYSQQETQALWNRAGMAEIGQWNHGDEYGVHMLSKPKMSFSMVPSVYGRYAIPSRDEWESLWEAWDVVTREMLPRDELLEKPIKLRNACIFYLGHIPAFLDIQLTKTTKLPPTQPAYFHGIFERGIDPDVDNPELCHAHSEIPDEWPPLNEILTYQDCVRSRLEGLYADGQEKIPRDVGRAIWVGFEHELMHIETLLYMMLQSNRTAPPPHIQRPDFEKLAAKARAERVANEWFSIPAQEISIGQLDPEDSDDFESHFAWDNEKPIRHVKVHGFQAQGRPISNEEYARYMYVNHIDKIPASWAETKNTNGVNGHGNGHSNGYSNGHGDPLPTSFLEGKAVRTVFGLVPLKHALDWPIFASYDELNSCAAWIGGRIPTFEEARSIYAHVDALKKKDPERQLGKTVPAVNGHLTNNGVEISPPPSPLTAVLGEQEQWKDLFIDLSDANVGFQHWHPVAVTGKGNSLAGQSEMGGVWEWTSSVLRPWDGFEPMSLYPGYTADFFDDKHNIVLGGSWATHPRIAGRKSFVNWYQRNYPYAWVGARLVRDLN